MYFSYTDEERKRIQLAKFVGVTIDPVGYGDLAALVIYSSVNLFSIFFVIYVWVNRKYAPLKAKNVPLMIVIYLHNVFFFFGDVVLCSLIHVRGPIIDNCMFMLIWVRTLFGNYSLGCLLIIRSYTLYRVFIQNKPFHGYKRCVPYAIFIFFLVLVGGISQAVPNSMTIQYFERMEICTINRNFITAIITMMWCVWGVFIVMVWRLRNVHSSFNECSEMTNSCIALILCTIYNQILLYAVPAFPTKLVWRISLVTFDQATANYIWWMIMGKTVFMCMFRRESYLRKWKQKLVSDGLRVQYGMTGNETETTGLNTTIVADSTLVKTTCEEGPDCSKSEQIALDKLEQLSKSRMLHRERHSSDEWYRADDSSIVNDETYQRHSISYSRATDSDDQDQAIFSMSASQIVDCPSSAKQQRQSTRSKQVPWLRQRSNSESRSRAFSSTSEFTKDNRNDCIFIESHTLSQEEANCQAHRNTSCEGLSVRSTQKASSVSEIQCWQASGTDLSLLSDGYGGDRHLL